MLALLASLLRLPQTIPPSAAVKNHQRIGFVKLTINNSFAIFLAPKTRYFMTTNITLGQTLPLSIAYFDTTGAPMATPVTPDSPPSWTDAMPSVDKLTVSADGLTASVASIAIGNDTVNLSVMVGGHVFTATLGVDVLPKPQTLGSVQIVPGTPF